MEEYLLKCISCGRPFFTKGEKAFYLRQKFITPSTCKDCRDAKKSITHNLLNEIESNWDIEAKNENNDYFFNTKETQELNAGIKYFVIGRKGTGKTAIAEHLSKNVQTNTFAENLSFKNFPFNDLYLLENARYTAPNQFITIWKYLIYTCVCKMMIKNEAIDQSIVSKLKKMYPDIKTSLSRMVETWTATGFGVELSGFGFGLGLSGQKEVKPAASLSWIETLNVLEEVVLKYLDKSKYFIIIDELDEDYREFDSNEDKKTYLQLLTSLFKAVQDVRISSKEHKLAILPIVFLRSDIYSLIKDSDKNKWSTFKIDLDWNEDDIKRMLAHRISVACNTGELNFVQAWNHLFANQKVEMGNQKSNMMSIFEFITRSTHLRPRDYIKYIIECAKLAHINQEKLISSKTVKRVDDSFSNYLKNEIIDEVHSVMPNINDIFEILSQIRKQTFHPSEFADIYNSYVAAKRIEDQGAENVLRMLFEFNVIGNQPPANSRAIFKYQNVSARFNYREKIMVHRGLYKALQIF